MTEETIEWTIRSFVGLGPLLFGMTSTQVQKEIGDRFLVKHRDTESDGSLREYRELEIPVCNYINGRLSGIDTTWRTTSVNLGRSYLYEIPPIDCLRFLEKCNGDAKIYLNLILFENIGISMNGFYSEKEKKILLKSSSKKDRRRIGVYQTGAFDRHIPKFQKITFF